MDNMNETPQIKTAQKGENSLAIPDKFLDKETGEIRADALLKSYLALEKKLSDKPVMMPVMAVPSKPEEYEVTLSSDMLSVDDALNKRSFEKGFSNEQVQEVYDIAAEKLVPMIADIMQDVQADRELERVVEKFGGTEKWMKLAPQLLAFGRKNLTPEMLASMTSSYDGIMQLYDMMKNARQIGGFDKSGKASTIAVDEKELTKMMRDPRYWKDKDPNFIAKVTEGFQNLYS